VTAGRPLLAAITKDRGAGVDPLSLVVGYKRILLLAAFYDPSSGLVIWLLDGAPKIGLGKTSVIAVASDYQEAKNVDQAGENILPNTAFRRFRLRGVVGPTITWLLPLRNQCVSKPASLAVSAGSRRGVRSVRFYDGHRLLGTRKRGVDGLFVFDWNRAKARRGRHVLRAVVTDRRGHHAQARRLVRVCRK
jgi:hypothetical protein